jgi:hypothetical protein
MFFQDLKTKLAKSQENSNITAKKFLLEKNELEKDKKELENRNKDYCKQIEKLNSNYVSIKIILIQDFLNSELNPI